MGVVGALVRVPCLGLLLGVVVVPLGGGVGAFGVIPSGQCISICLWFKKYIKT